MFNRSDNRSGERTGKRCEPTLRPVDLAVLVGAAALSLLLLLSASGLVHAGVSTDEGRSAFDAARAATSPPTSGAATQYQLRCWQFGRLVIEENGIELPNYGLAPVVPGSSASSPAGSLRLRAIDHERRPMFLTETRNATCLVRPVRLDPPATR